MVETFPDAGRACHPPEPRRAAWLVEDAAQRGDDGGDADGDLDFGGPRARRHAPRVDKLDPTPAVPLMLVVLEEFPGARPARLLL